MKGSPKVRQLKIKRLACQFAGHLLFGAGVVGIVLPVMPTTVFWIGAAACYLKSSPEAYQALISKKRYGKTIARYLKYGVITSSEKKIAVIGMLLPLVTLLLIPLDDTIRLLGVMGIAVAVTYVLTRPSEISTGQDQSRILRTLSTSMRDSTGG